MDLSVVFYGTGGSVPSARRATACVLIRAGGSRVLVDCGEGAQRQMMRSTGLVQVDEILITHLHADHYLGLPGLLKTYDLQERQAPLRIAGPKGLARAFRVAAPGVRQDPVRDRADRAGPGEGLALEHEGFEMRSFEVEHRMPANGYAFVEARATRAASTPTPRASSASATCATSAGCRGERRSPARAGRCAPSRCWARPRQGRKVVITGDTAPCEMTRIAAHGAQLLVHDGTFSDEEAARAAETGHSTARAAAELAAEAEVEMLALVHISSRYHVGAVLDEAREAFANTHAVRDFDLVEIPFPERGEPRLIERGAKQQREGPEPEPAPSGG